MPLDAAASTLLRTLAFTLMGFAEHVRPSVYPLYHNNWFAINSIGAESREEMFAFNNVLFLIINYSW